MGIDQATVSFAVRGLGLFLFCNPKAPLVLFLAKCIPPHSWFLSCELCVCIRIGLRNSRPTVVLRSCLQLLLNSPPLYPLRVVSAIPNYFSRPQNDNTDWLPSLGPPWSSSKAWAANPCLQLWKCSLEWRATVLCHGTIVSMFQHQSSFLVWSSALLVISNAKISYDVLGHCSFCPGKHPFFFCT